MYCERALNRCLKEGDRLEGPSKLEVISILTRDPTSTKMPHSMPVLLPTGNFYVIDFDGSTDIGDCLSVLCVQCGLRPALLSGYALYIEDVMEEGSYVLLKGKQKVTLEKKLTINGSYLDNYFTESRVRKMIKKRYPCCTWINYERLLFVSLSTNTLIFYATMAKTLLYAYRASDSVNCWSSSCH